MNSIHLGWCGRHVRDGRRISASYHSTSVGCSGCAAGYCQCCRRLRDHQADVGHVQAYVLALTVTSFPDLTLCSIGPTDPPEYPWLYGLPAVIFTGGFLAAASTGMAGLVQAGYLTSSVLCIGQCH